MSFAKRVVLDISTLISAVLRPDHTATSAADGGQRNPIRLPGHNSGIRTGTVLHDKLDHYLDQSARREFLELYRRHARLFNVTAAEEAALPQPCRDPRDHKFLALAVYCVADALVKLRLHHDNSHPSHPRLRPNIAKPSSPF